METNELRHYIAPDGKMYQAKDDESYIVKELWLGVNDSIDNYILIDEPTPPEPHPEPEPNGTDAE